MYRRGGKLKTIKDIYKIQAQNNITVRTGYTQKQSQNADEWIYKFGHLAAFLGWEHEIDLDFDDENSIAEKIKLLAPNHFIENNLIAVYELAVLVASNNTPITMET